MLRAGLTILQLPARATRTALQRATSPSALNTLSSAIAQGSIQTANETQSVQVEGLNIEIDFNDQRLLTTAGVSAAVAYGTLYWLGSKLKLQFRYAAMVNALEQLQRAIRAGVESDIEDSLRLIDNLSDPLIDPETLAPVESSDEVKAIYQQVMKRPAEPGSLFQASKLTGQVDDAVKLGSRAAVLATSEAVEEGIEAMAKKALPLAGRVGSRIVGAALWVDTVYWLGTSAIDVGLNYLGIPEDQQKIPFLSDIPGIGGLFDFTDGLGASAVDLVLTPILEGIFSLLGLEEEAESLIDILWGIIFSAATNPTLTPFIIAILDFYIDDVKIDFELSALFPISAELELELDLLKLFRLEPIDILVVWTYLIVGKILFKAWVKPAWASFTSAIKPE